MKGKLQAMNTDAPRERVSVSTEEGIIKVRKDARGKK